MQDNCNDREATTAMPCGRYGIVSASPESGRGQHNRHASQKPAAIEADSACSKARANLSTSRHSHRALITLGNPMYLIKCQFEW